MHRRTGLAKPTVHRLVAELIGWDVVERTPTAVGLGMRLFELGRLVPHQRNLLDATAPLLSDLFEATHETRASRGPGGRGGLRSQARRMSWPDGALPHRWSDARTLHRRRQGVAGIRATRAPGP